MRANRCRSRVAMAPLNVATFVGVIGHVFFPGSWSSRLSTLASTNIE